MPQQQHLLSLRQFSRVPRTAHFRRQYMIYNDIDRITSISWDPVVYMVLQMTLVQFTSKNLISDEQC
uniref:Uncharacterized protein n=1 Tax=Setaria italica TaxID=4555 RepID=K3Y273_SETIT